MNNLSLNISGITIGQDSEGRFSLNDLHKASGGNPSHLPSQWLRHQSTKDLIEECRKSLNQSIMRNSTIDKINHLEPINIVKSFFVTSGIFAIEELVYAYAMWISPAFQLKVIRAYAELNKAGRLPEATPQPLEQRVGNIERHLETMAEHMATLSKTSAQQAAKLDMTARYIGLLEINQKGKVKVTRTVEAQALALAAQGMPKADIARALRVSRTTVSLLCSGKYPLEAGQAALDPESVEEALDEYLAMERAAALAKLAARSSQLAKGASHD